MYNAVNDFIRQSPHTAIYYEDQVITYDELYSNVNRYRNELDNRFSRGDTIGIQMSDSPEWFYLFWACVKSNITPYLYSTLLSESETAELQKRYPICELFTDTNIAEFDVEANDISDNPAVNVERKDLCFYMFSSGTTGYYKRIPHKYGDMEFTAINYAKKAILLNSYDITFSAAKLFFAYGFGNSMTFPLYVGGSVVLMKEPSSVKNTLEHIEKYKPSVYFGVPSIYAGQIKSMEKNPIDTSSLRICVSAGEALPGSILKDWIEHTDTPILDGIGSTEALHIFITNRHEDFTTNCTGRLVSGFRAKVLDPVTQEEVPDGTIGDLYISGESVSEETEWMHTGDMFIRQGVRYYYQGRTNDMLKIGGVWVSPIEIESKIIEHDAVMEAGVVLTTDSDNLNKIKAYVVLKEQPDNSARTKVSIKRKCMEELPLNNYPHYIEFVDELPKTATGKIRRHILRLRPTDNNR